MTFHLDEAIHVLRRTPGVIRALIQDLPDQWTSATEGPGTWSPFDIVGHLIHGERTDWVPRVEHILRHGDSVPFPPFDREAMFALSLGMSLKELLVTFDLLRSANVERLVAMSLTEADLDRRGLHPELGVVTMRQHLATWTAHDLTHVGQMVRVMAKQYKEEVGPWLRYLPQLGADRQGPLVTPFKPEPGGPSLNLTGMDARQAVARLVGRARIRDRERDDHAVLER